MRLIFNSQVQTFVFQMEKKIQMCAGGARLRKGSFNCLC